MSRLAFRVLGASAEPRAIVPTLGFRLRIENRCPERIHSLALRCQIRVEPHRRHHGPAEQMRLLELFGEPSRWGETVRSLLWTHTVVNVNGFDRQAETDLMVPCSHEFDVVAARYFHALEDGDVPLRMLFSGVAFLAGEAGLSVEPIAWDSEAICRLPVRIWRDLMTAHFPDSVWIRVGRPTLDALHRFRAERALPGWDEAFNRLLEQAPRGSGRIAADGAS